MCSVKTSIPMNRPLSRGSLAYSSASSRLRLCSRDTPIPTPLPGLRPHQKRETQVNAFPDWHVPPGGAQTVRTPVQPRPFTLLKSTSSATSLLLESWARYTRQGEVKMSVVVTDGKSGGLVVLNDSGKQQHLADFLDQFDYRNVRSFFNHCLSIKLPNKAELGRNQYRQADTALSIAKQLMKDSTGKEFLLEVKQHNTSDRVVVRLCVQATAGTGLESPNQEQPARHQHMPGPPLAATAPPAPAARCKPRRFIARKASKPKVERWAAAGGLLTAGGRPNSQQGPITLSMAVTDLRRGLIDVFLNSERLPLPDLLDLFQYPAVRGWLNEQFSWEVSCPFPADAETGRAMYRNSKQLCHMAMQMGSMSGGMDFGIVQVQAGGPGSLAFEVQYEPREHHTLPPTHTSKPVQILMEEARCAPQVADKNLGLSARILILQALPHVRLALVKLLGDSASVVLPGLQATCQEVRAKGYEDASSGVERDIPVVNAVVKEATSTMSADRVLRDWDKPAWVYAAVYITAGSGVMLKWGWTGNPDVERAVRQFFNDKSLRADQHMFTVKIQVPRAMADVVKTICKTRFRLDQGIKSRELLYGYSGRRDAIPIPTELASNCQWVAAYLKPAAFISILLTKRCGVELGKCAESAVVAGGEDARLFRQYKHDAALRLKVVEIDPFRRQASSLAQELRAPWW